MPCTEFEETRQVLVSFLKSGTGHVFSALSHNIIYFSLLWLEKRNIMGKYHKKPKKLTSKMGIPYCHIMVTHKHGNSKIVDIGPDRS